MGIITDAVAIARILDIIVPETAAEMDYENLLNPSDDVYPSLLTHHTLILLFSHSVLTKSSIRFYSTLVQHGV
ncbi:hypothetical protein BLNAU_23042 [Blattamonas nauphoetae]|uniref:Uncharacterized protein n=1 Tax=Blattamonas nauphoetae TaxID=2049346 RepID=A0ABQ9WRC8_9EUKA|nr:hypothetical protein BLNAU_23042 [Blattamonas nauphoetae]